MRGAPAPLHSPAPLAAFGLETLHLNNVYFVSEEEIVYAADNFVFFQKLGGGERRICTCSRGFSVTSIALHPDRKLLAMSERSEETIVTIRDVEKMEIKHSLRIPLGSYCVDMSFSPDGNLLATLSSAPDYSLIIWNWEKESILLKTKAFSQATWRVQFSSFFERNLCTCGLGHIKFWNIASTFTGLKLKGDVGKFGQFEISDTYSVAELPTGHSATGTQSGQLVLWDGGLISGLVRGPGNKEAHTDFVTTTILYLSDNFKPSGNYGSKLSDKEKFDDPIALLKQLPPEFNGIPSKYPCILTGSKDGWIKLWPIGPIMGSLFSTNKGDEENNMYLIVEPLAEIDIGVPIIDIRISPFKEEGKEIWVIQTTEGLLQFDAISRKIIPITPAHTEPIYSSINRETNQILVGSSSGFLSLHSAATKEGKDPLTDTSLQTSVVRENTKYRTAVTSLISLEGCPYATFCIGYEDGSVRFFNTRDQSDSDDGSAINNNNNNNSSSSGLKLICSCKPHRSSVVQLCYDPKLSVLLSIDKDYVVYIFYIHEQVSIPEMDIENNAEKTRQLMAEMKGGIMSNSSSNSSNLKQDGSGGTKNNNDSAANYFASKSKNITPAVYINLLELIQRVKPKFSKDTFSIEMAIFNNGILTLYNNNSQGEAQFRHIVFPVPSMETIMKNTSDRSEEERSLDIDADTMNYTRFVDVLPAVNTLLIPRVKVSDPVEDILIAKVAQENAIDDDLNGPMDGPLGPGGGGSGNPSELDPSLVDISVDLDAMTSQDREALLKKHSELEAKQENPKIEPDNSLQYKLVMAKLWTDTMGIVTCIIVYIYQSEVLIGGQAVEWESSANVQEVISTGAKYLLQHRLRARSSQIYLFNETENSTVNPTAQKSIMPFNAIPLFECDDTEVENVVSTLDSNDTYTAFDIDQKNNTIILIDTKGRLVIQENPDISGILSNRIVNDITKPEYKYNRSGEDDIAIPLCGFGPGCNCYINDGIVFVVSSTGIIYSYSLDSLKSPSTIALQEKKLEVKFMKADTLYDIVQDIDKNHAVLEDIQSELELRRELDMKFNVKNKLLSEVHEIRKEYKELIEDVRAVSPNIQPDISICYVDKILDDMFNEEYKIDDETLVDKSAIPKPKASANIIRNLSHIPKYFKNYKNTYMGHNSPTLYVSCFRNVSRGVRTIVQYDVPPEVLLRMKKRFANPLESKKQSRLNTRGGSETHRSNSASATGQKMEGGFVVESETPFTEEGEMQIDDLKGKTQPRSRSSRGTRASGARGLRDHTKVQERQKKRDERMNELAELKKIKVNMKEIAPEDKTRIENARKTSGTWHLKLGNAKMPTVKTNHSIPDKFQEFVNQTYLLNKMILMFNTRVYRLLLAKGCIVIIAKLYIKLLVDIEAQIVETGGREILQSIKNIYGDPRNIIDGVYLTASERRTLFSKNGWKKMFKNNNNSESVPHINYLEELLDYDYAEECPKFEVFNDTIAKTHLMVDLVSTINPRGKQNRSYSSDSGIHNNNRPLTVKDKIVDYNRSMMIHLREAWLRVLEQIGNLVSIFDTTVEELITIYYDVKADQLRGNTNIVSLYNEISIQQIFKQRETDIIQQLADVHADREALKNEFMKLIPLIKAQIDKVNEYNNKTSELFKEFDNEIPDTSQYKTTLLKILNTKRKIKEVRNTNRDYDNEDSNETDWDDISSDDEFDTLPPGLSVEVYQKVLDMRTKKYAIEDQVAEERKKAEELTNKYDQLVKMQEKYEGIKTDLQRELNYIHKEKMDMINSITTIYPLTLSQIMITGDAPYTLDYSDKVLFSLDSFKNLHKRAYEHVVDRRSLLQELKKRESFKSEQATEERQEQKVLEDMEEKLKSVQLLKFGREVNLEDIDNISVNTKAEKLLETLEEEEKEFRKEEEELNNMIRDENELLRQSMESNTSVINSLYDLTKTQYDIENTIKKQEKNFKAVNSLNMTENIKRVEVEMLQRHVETQNETINELLAKISQLRSGKII